VGPRNVETLRGYATAASTSTSAAASAIAAAAAAAEKLIKLAPILFIYLRAIHCVSSFLFAASCFVFLARFVFVLVYEFLPLYRFFK
jgi:hypothetical protein